MKYVSTRGRAPDLAFDEVLLAGLAEDGGLYVPETWPELTRADFRRLAGRPYADVAFEVLRPFVGDAVRETDLKRMIEASYAAFEHAAVAPLRQLDHRLWLLELFHGPTLAFKDYALQLLGRLFDHVLAERDERVTVVGATSGDTGSAAIAACRNCSQIDIFILHPAGRVSEVQRRQMTTVEAANVHNIAIDGSFDDCQDLVKAMFNDAAFRREMGLSAVNSINWARIAAQIVYYVYAALALGAPDRQVSFAVPTGNFGNVYAGFAARRMGAPIERLIVASNENDILTRTFESATMSVQPVRPTLSPSMDIQVSSNFERLLFEMTGRDGKAVRKLMEEFRARGSMTIGGSAAEEIAGLFAARRLDDPGTLEEIDRLYRESLVLIDPHTAVGVSAARRAADGAASAIVTLATAHPAKFPDAVEQATGVRPDLPERLADLYRRRERCTRLPNDLAAVQAHVRERTRAARRGVRSAV